MRIKIKILMWMQVTIISFALFGTVYELQYALLGLTLAGFMSHLFLYDFAFDRIKDNKVAIDETKELLGFVSELHARAGKSFVKGDESLGNFYLNLIERIKKDSQINDLT